MRISGKDEQAAQDTKIFDEVLRFTWDAPKGMDHDIDQNHIYNKPIGR